MSSGQGQDGGGGCAALFAGLLVIAAIVAGLVSLAALIDPFSWMPTAAELWEDCQDDWDTERDECAWNNRFPGIWVHAIVNLLYVGAAACLLLWVVAAVRDLREARAERFSDVAGHERYISARQAVTAAAVWTGLIAALPFAAALA